MEKEQLIALVKKSQSGDAEAIEKLLQYAHTSVSYQCRKMLNNEQDAEDMTQEVLVTIYTKLDTLQEPAAFWKWANQITATRCINALNRTHVEYQFAEDEEGHSILDNLEELDEQAIPDKAIDNAETARMIEEIVTSLPDAQRAATLMFYYNEMSVKEIAKTMKVSENTVKSRLNYARKAIKEKVLDYEKQGVKLYGLSPLPFLLYFLRLAANLQKDEQAAGIMVAEVMAAESAAVGVAAGAGGAAATAGAGAAAATTATVASTGSTAAGIFASLSAKVVAGILATVVAIGSIAAVVIPNTQGDATEPSTIPTESTFITEDGKSETSTPTTEIPVTEGTTAPEETESTTESIVTEPTTVPGEMEAATEPEATQPTQTPTEDPASTEAPASGDCPSCGIGNITVVMLSEPTCTLRGEAAGQCNHCGYIAGYSYPPANGHTSGLSEDGQYYICTVCGEILEPVGIGHGGVTDETEHVHSYNGVVTEPTCTAGGYTTYTCSCGDSYKGDETAATGHSMVQTDCVYPTCDTVGQSTMTCSACGCVETTEIPIHGTFAYECVPDYENDGHRWDKTVVCANPDCPYFSEYLEKGDVVPHNYEIVFDCPCGPTAYTDYKCVDCGYTSREHYDPVYPEHNYVAVEGLEPGYRKCTQCGLTAYSDEWLE